jgi:4-hydroxyphenylacetate 3-hydroxylase, reductase component
MMSSAPPSGADPSIFRLLMSRWPTGVSVVTAHADGVDAGLTVNAFLSVSLRPPSVLVSLSTDADTVPVIERSRRFAVNLLAAGQRALSERFAQVTPSAEKFRGVPVHRAPGGIALLDGTLGAFTCRVVASTPQFDHLLIVGEVDHQEVGVEGWPLVFFHSGYGDADEQGRVRLPAPRR